MVTQILKDQQEAEVRTAYLWVLGGNLVAMRLPKGWASQVLFDASR
jgi:hypothetical protein